MKCLNCGRETAAYLCGDCLTEEALYEVFYKILFYRPDDCPNPYIAEYVSAMTEKYQERDCIPAILEQFDFEIAEYYYCQYYKACKDPRFEDAAKHYLAGHPWEEIRSQKMIYGLLELYLRNDFISPRKWCDGIAATDQMCCELYVKAAQYYGMIGEYDASDAAVDKALAYCADPACTQLLYSTREGMIKQLEKQKADTLRYRTKKPYWPQTEARRRAVAMFYDEKGIRYPRIDNRPVKVPESEFAPLRECYDDAPEDYCAFWCAETFSITPAKGIYQIAAVKVRDGRTVEEFQSLIRPWDGLAHRKDAAKKAKLELSEIEHAEDVDQVMEKFFAFVEGDVLVSTGALGNQANLIRRAARYAGMKEIPNEFFDLLDLAADTSSLFDMANNTRACLLEHFGLPEGEDALAKARVNRQLFEALRNYGT